jgi:hypothetical protein
VISKSCSDQNENRSTCLGIVLERVRLLTMRRFNFGILLSWHQSILARDARRSPEVSRSLSAAKWGTRERRLLVVVAPDSKAFDTKQRTRSAFGSFSRTLQDDGRNGVEISRGNIQLDKQRRQRNSKKISESSHRPS